MSAVRLARAATGREVVRQVRRRLPRPLRRPARRRRLGPGDAGDPGQPGSHRRPGGDHRRRALERPRRGQRSARRARRSPPCWPSRSPPTWASSRRPTASSSSCARRRSEAGALLVFDEVITGFRVARGGAQELYGVEPDLTVLGKVLGGGLPAAAFAGPREPMERIAPAGDVYQAGTLSGNPLAIAAGLATLRQLDAAAYERLAELTERLAAGFARARRRPSAPGRLRPRPAHPLLQRRAGRRLRRRSRLRPRGPRPLLPRDARPRRLPAALAVRGLVRLPRPRRGRRSTAPSKPPPRRSTEALWLETDERCTRRHDV